MTRVKLIGLAAGMVLALAATACSGDDDPPPAVTTNTPTQAVTTAATTAGTSPAAAATSTPTTTGGAASPAATATAAGGAASPAAGAAQTIEIRSGERSSSEYFFEPKELTATAGQVTFRLTNAGPERPHTFVVNRGGTEVGRIDRTEPNQNRQVAMTLTAGTYEFICGLPGHADRGQKGTLTVR
jgi:uncharacterized cupredoxin-like copper-binding protein